jgi:hypothetical protein
VLHSLHSLTQASPHTRFYASRVCLKMRLATVSGLFSLAASALAATSGILFLQSNPTHPELTDADFNDWYTNEHIPQIVKAGLADLGLRYKNMNSSAKWRYLALYRLPDASKLGELVAMKNVPATSDKLPGKVKGSKGGAYKDVMAMDGTAYARIQTFEGQIKRTGRGKGLTTASVQPANGTDAEFDDFYRRQHLDMLRYARQRRYIFVSGWKS